MQLQIKTYVTSHASNRRWSGARIPSLPGARSQTRVTMVSTRRHCCHMCSRAARKIGAVVFSSPHASIIHAACSHAVNPLPLNQPRYPPGAK